MPPETSPNAPAATVDTPVAAPVAQSPDAAFDAVLAKAHERATADLTPAATPKRDEGAPAPKAEINIDPDTLRTLTGLQRSKRELEAQIADLQGKATAGSVALEAQELWKAGKKMDAIAKISGEADSLEAMQKLLTDFVEAPETDTETKIAAQVKELTDKLEAEVTARQTAEKTLVQRQQEQERNAAMGFAVSKLDPAKYELCAKEENKAEMAETALEAVPVLIRNAIKEKLSADPSAEQLDAFMRELSQDDYAGYFDKAYALLEARLESVGQRYSKAPKTAQQGTQEAKPAPTTSTLSRPTISTAKPATGPVTQDEAVARALERARTSAQY